MGTNIDNYEIITNVSDLTFIIYLLVNSSFNYGVNVVGSNSLDMAATPKKACDKSHFLPEQTH